MDINYDEEVDSLVARLNCSGHGMLAEVIDDPSAIFRAIIQLFPIMAGGFDWKRISVLSTTAPVPNESADQALRRVLGELKTFLSNCHAKPGDRLIMLSDDFYSKAIRCTAESVVNVIEAWLPLPHAIMIVPEDMRTFLYVSFAGTTFVARSRHGRN